MLEPNLKYNFPIGNSDPFDPSFDGNYFAYANAHSNLGKTLDDFSMDVLGKNIDMGYKTIILCRRLALIEKGVIQRAWSFNDFHLLNNNNCSGKFFLTTNSEQLFFRKDWNSDIKTTVIYKPDAADAGLQSCIWEDLSECQDYAMRKSKEINDMILISIVIDTLYWH